MTQKPKLYVLGQYIFFFKIKLPYKEDKSTKVKGFGFGHFRVQSKRGRGFLRPRFALQPESFKFALDSQRQV